MYLRAFSKALLTFSLVGGLSLFARTALALDEPLVKPTATQNFTEEEIKELREWIVNKKQSVGIKSLGGELTFSGEVHADCISSNEIVNGVKQRGLTGAYPNNPTRDYDIELDLLLNYRFDPTWATARLKFRNKAGVESGTKDKLALDRAFMGVRFLEGETYTMDLEVGRRKLNYTFDSKVQFGSLMDGILYKYDQSIETVGDLYLHAGPFVVDYKNDHYAYILEFGVLNIGNTGIYTKYSFIDWDTKHYANVLKERYYRFMNSQLTLGYKTVPKWLDKVLTIYSAGLLNSAAHELAITDWSKANYAWYVGFSLGEVRKQGDWSFDANYQKVMPQAVPSFDASGIGRGNAADAGFYFNRVGSTLVPTTRATAVGSTNYEGFALTLLYLFTNNLTLSQVWQQSIRADKSVGPIFSFKQYTLELVYLF